MTSKVKAQIKAASMASKSIKTGNEYHVSRLADGHVTDEALRELGYMADIVRRRYGSTYFAVAPSLLSGGSIPWVVVVTQ